jgi:hypothetical protein
MSRECTECDGDGIVVVGSRWLETPEGILVFEHAPCDRCSATGRVDDLRSGFVVVWILAALLAAIAIALLIIAAPRSEPSSSSTASPSPGDVSRAAGASGPTPTLSGAPLAMVWTERRIAGERVTRGAPLTLAGSIGSALIAGQAGYAEESYGPRYLAAQLPRGTRVRICGAVCRVMTTTDYGPDPRIVPPRVADIAVRRWETICGLPRTRGLCDVTIETLDRGAVLPPTDVEPEGSR